MGSTSMAYRFIWQRIFLSVSEERLGTILDVFGGRIFGFFDN